MPEPRDLPLFRWGEELRRHQVARRASRWHTAATTGAAVVVTSVIASLLWPPQPVLIWNASASSPIGLYHVTPADEVRKGDMAVAWPPEPARRLAGERGYLPVNVPLVKRVTAASGDRVCAVGEAIFVNGRLAAIRRAEDSRGRPLPSWTGCEWLEDGKLFLLMPGTQGSFDGRYFGVTERRYVVGRARLIWAL